MALGEFEGLRVWDFGGSFDAWLPENWEEKKRSLERLRGSWHSETRQEISLDWEKKELTEFWEECTIKSVWRRSKFLFSFFSFLEEKSFKHVLFNFLHILLMIISPSISFPSILLRFENYLWLVWMHRPHRLLVVIDWMIIEDDWLFILRIYFTHYFSLFSFT